MAVPEQDFSSPESLLEGDVCAFPTTHWTAVLSAGHSDATNAAEAMEALCAKYWYPIYAFVRWRRGVSHHEAEDLAQAFFGHLLEKEELRFLMGVVGR
jgi:hypothetical protein